MKTFLENSNLFYVIPFFTILTFNSCSEESKEVKKQIDISGFFDSAHHWKDITDSEQVFFRLPDQRSYSPNQVKEIADNILLYQQKNGGWPKNYDMLAVLTEQQKQILAEKSDSDKTTFDNGSTYSQVEYLAKAYSQLKDDRYKEACLKGLNFILTAQYKNGGWPQFYPDTSGYRKYITFNDGAMIGILKVFKDIVNDKSNYSFIESELRDKIKESFWKGIDCILKCQIKENNELTVWCQQHDNIDFHPRNARTFELASKVGEESADIVLLLMDIKNPSNEIIKSVKSAVKWFRESEIKGLKVESIPAPKIVYKYHEADSDKVVIEDPSAPSIWARFYELNTNKPLFANRDGKPVYKLSDVDRERRTGYTWYLYNPQEVLDKYPEWLESIETSKKI